MSQMTFAAALLAPDAPVPVGLVDPRGRPCPERFGVYRNNFAASLTRVLQAGFPVVEKLVGLEFFQAMAVEFARKHPPKTRQMMLYGDEFADFLAGFPPVAGLPYLADVARLEQAIRESYHSSDHKPVPTNVLAQYSAEALMHLKVRLAPSLRMIRSDWPILSIWTANREGGAMPPSAAQDVVILRAEYDPKPFALPGGGADLLAALARGLPFGEALDLAVEDADFVGLLSLLLSQNAIEDIK
jgi:hypothetical protein